MCVVAGGIVHVAVVQAQVDQVCDGYQGAANAHNHGVFEQVVVDFRP